MMDNRQKQEEAVDLVRRVMDAFLDEDTEFNSTIPEEAEANGVPRYAAAARRAYSALSNAMYVLQSMMVNGNTDVDEETAESLEILMRAAAEGGSTACALLLNGADLMGMDTSAVGAAVEANIEDLFAMDEEDLAEQYQDALAGASEE